MPSAWVKQTIEHWREHRPTLYRQVNQSGQLEARAQKAVDLTK